MLTRRVIARSLTVAAAAGLVPGCAAKPAPMARADLERFIGLALPAGTRHLQAATEAGLDRLVVARFEAPEAEVTAFALALTGEPPQPGSDAYVDYSGSGLAWWPRTAPALSASAQGRTDSPPRAFKLLVTPAGANLNLVHLAAFSY